MDYTDKKEEAIGIFDSGVGGISVLKVLQKELPHENFIFFGDQSNAPYGEKSEEELRELALSAYHFLQEKKSRPPLLPAIRQPQPRHSFCGKTSQKTSLSAWSRQ